jgi:hypothetical protein
VAVAESPGARPAAGATAAGRGVPWSLPGAVALGLAVVGGALVAARRRRTHPTPEV